MAVLLSAGLAMLRPCRRFPRPRQRSTM